MRIKFALLRHPWRSYGVFLIDSLLSLVSHVPVLVVSRQLVSVLAVWPAHPVVFVVRVFGSFQRIYASVFVVGRLLIYRFGGSLVRFGLFKDYRALSPIQCQIMRWLLLLLLLFVFALLFFLVIVPQGPQVIPTI